MMKNSASHFTRTIKKLILGVQDAVLLITTNLNFAATVGLNSHSRGPSYVDKFSVILSSLQS